MIQSTEALTFATQGDELSFHAVAARKAANGLPVDIMPLRRFGDVVRASRKYRPGLGVIAISTVAGTVEDSARSIVRRRPSALAPIVGRTDISIELALMGSEEQSVTELGRTGVKVLAQKAAVEQCRWFLGKYLPQAKINYRGESIEAAKEALEKGSPNYLAIAPRHAVDALGGVEVVPGQINPRNSITSFYVLQRNPTQELIPPDPEKFMTRTVVSLAHPDEDGAFDKCLEVAARFEIDIGRYIPFVPGDFTKHNPNLPRVGGLLELEHDIYDELLTEFCARVNALKSNDGADGPFGTNKLGSYAWYPEQPVSYDELLLLHAKPKVIPETEQLKLF